MAIDMPMSSAMSMLPTSTGMAMSGMSMSHTTTGMTGMASSTGGAMGDMGGMGMGGGCKISMLWNWNVMDTCFISSSWHIRSKGMFAGSLIGVILLVVLLEFLRRAAKEYDRFIVAQHTKTLASSSAVTSSASSDNVNGHSTRKTPVTTALPVAAMAKFRPSILQQAVRALLHMCQFAVAYFIMLLAMYYNGYMIICIFIGAYIGFFVFGWESFGAGQDRMEENVTVCCG